MANSREWREKQEKAIKARDGASEAKRQETIAKAERAIDAFYEDYAHKKERNIRENKWVSCETWSADIGLRALKGTRETIPRGTVSLPFIRYHLVTDLRSCRTTKFSKQNYRPSRTQYYRYFPV